MRTLRIHKAGRARWIRWQDSMAPQMEQWRRERDRKYRGHAMSVAVRKFGVTRLVKQVKNRVRAASVWEQPASSVEYQ
jgi:hypothetical protein